MKILITGGAGFIGYHAAEYFARRKNEVTVLDSLSTGKNFECLSKHGRIRLIKGDIRNKKTVAKVVKGADCIIHAAGQVEVTSSLANPWHDFEVNVIGTVNLLDTIKKLDSPPIFVFCSSNKVYGDNVNKIPMKEEKSRYTLLDGRFTGGIPESFSVDSCGHTPYGCSKLAADLYVQEYGQSYGIDFGIFRMSCIYGPMQFGTENQGWVAHFIRSTLYDKPITIFGNGKQVRDVLFIDDLIKAFEALIEKREECSGEVYNIGGGVRNTLSLIELLNILEDLTGKRSRILYGGWRPYDQKIYVSDTSRARKEIGWSPRVNVKKGIETVIGWSKSLS